MSCVLAACGSGHTAPTDPEVQAFVTLVNEHREDVGCGELAWNSGMGKAAQDHTDDMVENGFFSHESQDGRTFDDRLREAGVVWTGTAGENIAGGYASAEEVLAGWLGSPGHRANIENCAHTHLGVGRNGTLWTLDLAQNVTAP